MRFVISAILLWLLSCETSTKDLPILSYTVDESGQKQYYKMTYDGFSNQLGESFTTKSIDGKICIANFFFTRCPSICPAMRTELISIAEAFSKDDNVMLISHTIDPKNDSISVLKAYAEATGIPESRWQFIRASEKHIKLQAKKYMTNFKPNEEGSDFYHSSFVALVDQKQNIRGFYNVLIDEEVLRLINDIKRIAH